jgi:phage protein D/phage baseplate assembly protein gpV
VTPVATAEQHVASYDLLVDGADIAREHLDRITEIRVTDYLQLPDVCTIRITYPRGRGVDDMPFAIGKGLEVQLGAKEALMPQSLFRGDIVTLEPDFGAGGVSVLIRAFDRSHRLHRARHSRTFANMTASDMVEKICRDAGLTADTESSGEPYDHFHQENETDWDFCWRLAERIGFEVVVEDQTLYFRKPKTDNPVELTWPETLRSFRPRVTAVQQVTEVTVRAWDPKTNQAIEATATTPNQVAEIGLTRDEVVHALPGEATVHVATEPVARRGQADAIAQALLDKLANGYVAAEGVAPGNPKIRAGATVKVGGIGTKFSGIYRVATSTHVLRGSGYETHFANSPSHTILGAVAGDGKRRFGDQLVVGIVTNNDDPDGMGRVAVKLPALADDIESAWAHVATLNAGNERGIMMLPVPGDEVLIGFEHGDMTRPYVLGSIFNGQDKPGKDLLQNKDASFAFKTEHKAYMESGEDFTIQSGGALSITVQQQDGTISVKQGGLNLEAANAISLKSQQADVTIEGTMSLTLKCGASQIQLSASGVTISGPTISIG